MGSVHREYGVGMLYRNRRKSGFGVGITYFEVHLLFTLFFPRFLGYTRYAPWTMEMFLVLSGLKVRMYDGVVCHS